MIDESYHIEDVDEIYDSSSAGEIAKEKTDVIKTRVIYENSDTSDREEHENDSRAFFGKEDINQSFESYTEKDSYSIESENIDSSEKKYSSRKKTFIEEWLIDVYNKRPNTLKATIVGIIIALLILFIGFLKTLLIVIVVAVANLIGQLLDSNPRLLYIIDLVRQRFR